MRIREDELQLRSLSYGALAETNLTLHRQTLAGPQGTTQIRSLATAQGVADGALRKAHLRLTSSSRLDGCCSPARTKADLAEKKNCCDYSNLGSHNEFSVASPPDR